MREQIRVEYISRLTSSISKIGPGSMFERFGAKFLDHHLGMPLIHRGLNVQLNPVGHTIDSYDEAGLIGAEYSIDQSYFVGSMTKASGDLIHVLRKHPDARDIYLLSSQLAPTGAILEFTARVARWPGLHDRAVHLYDARRIAEIIIDELIPSERAIDDLTEQLPALTHIIDDNAATLAVPGLDPGHVARPEMIAQIDAVFAGGASVVTLSGIGGLGKTRVAMEYAAERRGEYDTCIWIDGTELQRVEEAKAIPMWRGGESRNVAALLKSRPCLLVVDDAAPNLDVAGFAGFCRPGSHVLITRRNLRAGDIELPMMSEAMARDLLDRDAHVPCPDDTFRLFMESVGAHPLSLALINRTVVSSELSWAEVASDVASIPELVDGDARLADLLLGRLEGILSTELEIFQWAGSGTVDLRFLTDVLGPIRTQKLRGFGLTTADRPGTIKLHDIVFASVVTKDWLTAGRSAELDHALEAFIKKLMNTEGLALRMLASTMKQKLVELSGERQRPAFMVALLEVWRPSETRPELLFDPISAVAALAEKEQHDCAVEVRAVLETIEGLYRFEKGRGIDNARAKLTERLPVFDELLALPGLTERSWVEILHHQAKALKNLGSRPEAQAIFEAVVGGPHPLPAARLQLVRLYGDSDLEKAFDQADAIFAEAENEGTVSSNIILATFKDLPAVLRERILDRHADLVEREIIAAAEAQADDTIPALAAAARHWSWSDRGRLMKIFDSISLPEPSVMDDRARAACGELLGLVATGPAGVDPEFQRLGLEYFEAVDTPTSFGLQQHGQLLVEMGRYPDAEAILKQISNPPPFTSYWLSRAQLGKGDIGSARTSIDTAIAELKDPRHQRFLSSFLVQKFEIRAAAGEADAREDLLQAHAICEDPRYRESIEKRIAEIGPLQ